MSSPFEYSAFTDSDLQASTMPSDPSKKAMAWEWVKRKTAEALHSRPSDQQISFDGAQSISSRRSSNEHVPGTTQSVEDRVHPSIEEANEESRAAPDHAAGDPDPSTIDVDVLPSGGQNIGHSQEQPGEVTADSQAFKEGERRMDMQIAAPESDVNHPTHTPEVHQLYPVHPHYAMHAMGHGPPMQGAYTSINQGQWNLAYYGQPAPTHGLMAGQNPPFPARYIHDSASAYNSSGNRSTVSSERQAGTTGNMNRTKSHTPNDIENPLALPGGDHESITNPGSGPQHSPTPEVQGLLSLLDRQNPGYLPNLTDLYKADISGANTHTVFPDAQAAHNYDDQKNIADDTIPSSINQQRAMVKALVDAIKSIEHAQDNPNMIKPFREGKFSDARIEKVCWSLVQTCMYRHSKGFLLAPFEMKPKQSHELMTFAERLSKILQLLTVQKTICKHLLDPYYLFQFVDDPIGAHKRVLANMSLNRRKGRYMTAGKEVFSKSSPVDSPQAKPGNAVADTPSSVAHFHSGMTPSSNLDDRDRTLTPDATRQQQLVSSLTSSSPAVGRISGVGSGFTSHRLPSRLAMPAPTSPSPAPRFKGPCVDHIQRLHGRRLSITSFPGNDVGGVASSHSRSTSFDGNAGSKEGIQEGIPQAAQENLQAVNNTDDSQNTEGTKDTSTRQLRSSSVTSYTSSGHKRGASELDEETTSKKQRR